MHKNQKNSTDSERLGCPLPGGALGLKNFEAHPEIWSVKVGWGRSVGGYLFWPIFPWEKAKNGQKEPKKAKHGQKSGKSEKIENFESVQNTSKGVSFGPVGSPHVHTPWNDKIRILEGVMIFILE